MIQRGLFRTEARVQHVNGHGPAALEAAKGIVDRIQTNFLTFCVLSYISTDTVQPPVGRGRLHRRFRLHPTMPVSRQKLRAPSDAQQSMKPTLLPCANHAACLRG